LLRRILRRAYCLNNHRLGEVLVGDLQVVPAGHVFAVAQPVASDVRLNAEKSRVRQGQKAVQVFGKRCRMIEHLYNCNPLFLKGLRIRNDAQFV
jgi:hypothetical protein